jgi:hypothetical protein
MQAQAFSYNHGNASHRDPLIRRAQKMLESVKYVDRLYGADMVLGCVVPDVQTRDCCSTP